ncbi:2'-5' RNA ligase family protein [Actinomadura chokoriensis]|uniref:2'-5' RNA ligase family protein n=1 Tax=Actinomadura chokoriensis TaxID=454156 RepID=A0ABV4R0I9_9ACTN
MEYALVLPVAESHSERIKAFRAQYAGWASRPMRSWPHLSIKGGAGLSAEPGCLDLIREIAAATSPFEVRLGGPAVFPGDGRVLHLQVESPGWGRLHRTLVDTVARHTGAQLHPLEVAGWIPHVTLLRLTAQALERRDEVYAAVRRAVPTDSSFVVETVRMERFDSVANWWKQFHEFDLTGAT